MLRCSTVAHHPTPEFPSHLEALYRGFPFARSLEHDPLGHVRPLARDARSGEVAGIFASTLAIGNTTAIRGAFVRLTSIAGGDLTSLVRDTPAVRSRRLQGFRHRWIRGDQLARLAARLGEIYGSYDGLEGVFVEGMESTGEFASGVDALARALRGPTRPAPPRGYAHLFPSPKESPRSPCKRLTLFVRWMVRPTYPDLGLWTKVPPSTLRIPLDQHVYWIAYHLGLTRRKSRSWATVEEVTAALRAIDPADPVKYDFVLCHTGISGDCPKRRDMAVCGPCVVRPDCLLWRLPGSNGRARAG